MAKLSSAELAKREDVIMKMKKNKRSLVKRYGPDAEKVMYGRATNIAKKVAESEMEKSNLKELVRAALMNEKAGFSKEYDDNPALKGGQKNLPDGLQKAIINKAKSANEDFDRMYLPTDDGNSTNVEKQDQSKQMLKSAYSRILDGHRALVNHITKTYPELTKDQKVILYFNDINTGLKTLKNLEQSKINEDLDLGHEDNEPHMIKAELYRIGKYAMELYQMVDEFEGKGEVDFPAWWQSKITTSANNMVSAKHYLDFELKEPEIDAMVGAIDMSGALDNIGVEDEIKEGLPKGYFKKATAELDESFKKLVGKLKKGGKSEKAAKAIAGAVASYKAKGGGKGPTAKQKARINEMYFLKMDEYTPGFGEIENSDLYKYKVVYYKDKEGKQPIAQTIFKYEPNHDKIFAAMNSSNYFDKKDVQLYKAFDASGKEYPIAGDPKDISLSTLKAVGFREKPELGWQAG